MGAGQCDGHSSLKNSNVYIDILNLVENGKTINVSEKDIMCNEYEGQRKEDKRNGKEIQKYFDGGQYDGNFTNDTAEKHVI